MPIHLPVIIGHEMVGRILEVGPGGEIDSVGQKLKIGDRIVWTHTSCGACFHCTVTRQPALCDNRRFYMYETMAKPPYLMGGFSEYGYVLPDAGRIRVPDEVPNELATLASCAFRSVMNAFEQLGAIAPTETVVVQGAGPLGLLAAAVARASGAAQVIVVGAPRTRLQMAEALGADATISIQDSTVDDRVRKIQDRTRGRGADIIAEFTGVPEAMAEGLEMARKGARYLMVGQVGAKETSLQPSSIVKKNITVIGSFSGDSKSYWTALQFLKTHAHLPFADMITNRYRLADVNTALERMRNYDEIKPVIEF
jgi:threonine dehydrogenase-like Zn-dependent dehydrogenase